MIEFLFLNIIAALVLECYVTQFYLCLGYMTTELVLRYSLCLGISSAFNFFILQCNQYVLCSVTI